MGEIVKIEITFHFYPLRVTFGAFGVRSSSGDCDRSGRPFGTPPVPGKRPLLLLHFHTIFSAFHPQVDPLQGDLQKLGLRPLAQLSGTGPRQWGVFPKGAVPLARPNFSFEFGHCILNVSRLIVHQ